MNLEYRLIRYFIGLVIAGTILGWALQQVSRIDLDDIPEGDLELVDAGIAATIPETTMAEAPVVTTTTSAPTTTTMPPTTLAIPSGAWQCPEVMALAVTVGWPLEELDTLDAIVWRESRCDGRAHNTADPATGSRGLLQVNGYWCHTTNWLQQQGVLDRCSDLFDDVTSLRAGLVIYNRSGWSPWGGRP